MLLPWLQFSLPWSELGPATSVHLENNIYFSCVVLLIQGVPLLPHPKDKTLCGKPLNGDSSCCLRPESCCWNRAAWMPAGRFLAGKMKPWHGSHPALPQLARKAWGCSCAQHLLHTAAWEGCYARYLPPSASSTVLLLSFPRSTGLHVICYPPAAFVPGSGFLKMGRDGGSFSFGLAPSGSLKVFGKKLCASTLCACFCWIFGIL